MFKPENFDKPKMGANDFGQKYNGGLECKDPDDCPLPKRENKTIVIEVADGTQIQILNFNVSRPPPSMVDHVPEKWVRQDRSGNFYYAVPKTFEEVKEFINDEKAKYWPIDFIVGERFTYKGWLFSHLENDFENITVDG